ncbi:MAG: hypothetical protein DRH56_07070 [Deltaproteobacteria bacterium]|nr:MAG: hypothetical protein DRH56_07070 [Deltaproteobacteria bacterium]
MHIYWRVIEELKFLGENVILKDPSLSRCYTLWLKKNAEAIALSLDTVPSPLFRINDIPQSLN